MLTNTSLQRHISKVFWSTNINYGLDFEPELDFMQSAVSATNVDGRWLGLGCYQVSAINVNGRWFTCTSRENVCQKLGHRHHQSLTWFSISALNDIYHQQ